MDINELKENQMIKIKGKVFEILKIENEVECVPIDVNPRRLLEISLLEKERGNITPSHRLFAFFNPEEFCLIDDKTKEKIKLNPKDLSISP